MTEGHDPYNHVGRLMQQDLRSKPDIFWAREVEESSLFGPVHEWVERSAAISDWQDTIKNYREAFARDK